MYIKSITFYFKKLLSTSMHPGGLDTKARNTPQVLVKFNGIM